MTTEAQIRLFSYPFLVLGVVLLRKAWELKNSPAAPQTEPAQPSRGLEDPGPEELPVPATVSPDTGFSWWMVVHLGWVFLAGVEVWLMKPPFTANLVLVFLGVWALALGLKWWAMDSLGETWTLRAGLPPQSPSALTAGPSPVTTGPYAALRHPEYLGELLEVLTVPLLVGAYWTALPACLLTGWMLVGRIQREEALWGSVSDYQHHFEGKKRMFPALW